MKKMINDYQYELKTMIKKIDQNQISLEQRKAMIDYHLATMNNFQHERLIHLLVTFFFGFLLLQIFGWALTFDQPWLYFLSLVIAITEIFYLKHYFFLENTIQKLYREERGLWVDNCSN